MAYRGLSPEISFAQFVSEMSAMTRHMRDLVVDTENCMGALIRIDFKGDVIDVFASADFIDGAHYHLSEAIETTDAEGGGDDA